MTVSGGGGEARGEGRGRDQDGVADVLPEVHAAALRQAGGGRLQPLLRRGPRHHRTQEELGNQVNVYIKLLHKWIIKLSKSTMYRNFVLSYNTKLRYIVDLDSLIIHLCNNFI